MTATNHALTGAVIGVLVGQPWLAVPLAVASHFVCDALPHFGVAEAAKKRVLKSDRFRNYLVIEALLCAMIVIAILSLRPQHWQLAAACAFAAAAPDLLSINRYLKTRQGKAWRPGWYSRFAHRIQWFEWPVGVVVEVAWLIAALVVLAPFIK